jgi:general secretion pathway protein H
MVQESPIAVLVEPNARFDHQSPTGSWAETLAMRRHTSEAASTRGFTLIEVLVVMLIMGLIVGLASAIVRPDDRGLLRVEADRLAQLLDLAASEARLTGNPMAWTADATGYRFWRERPDGEWTEARDSDLLRARTLPRGMAIAGLQIENAPARGSMRLEFSPDRSALSFSIELSLGAVRYTVSGDPVGEVSVLTGEGDSSGSFAQR